MDKTSALCMAIQHYYNIIIITLFTTQHVNIHRSLIVHSACSSFYYDFGVHHFAATFGGLGGIDAVLGMSDLHDVMIKH